MSANCPNCGGIADEVDSDVFVDGDEQELRLLIQALDQALVMIEAR